MGCRLFLVVRQAWPDGLVLVAIATPHCKRRQNKRARVQLFLPYGMTSERLHAVKVELGDDTRNVLRFCCTITVTPPQSL